MNSLWLTPVILSLIAGSSIFLGAYLASKENIHRKWLESELHHGITALGGGALVAAIALVLIPEGLKYQPLWLSISSFAGGGIAAMSLDRYFAKRKDAVSQLMAMLFDYVPETIVIGAIFTKNYSEAILLTIIIFIQNLPESFSAYREIKHSKTMGTKKLLKTFFIISLTGPLFVGIGAFLFTDSEMLLGSLMTFCAGAILYLMFNDIAPQVQLKNRYFPPFGALLGFIIGMIGYQLTRGY